MPRPRGHFVLGLAGLWALLWLSGCAGLFQGKARPVEAPDLTLTMRQFAGTPLSGPTGAAVAIGDVGQAFRVDVAWIAVDHVPATRLAPLDSQSRLTVAPLNSDTLLPTGMLTRTARFGADRDAREFFLALASGKLGRAKIAAAQTGLLVAGTTILFDSADVPRDEQLPRRVQISLSRSPGAATQAATQSTSGTVAVRLDDYVQKSHESGLRESRVTTVSFGQETAVLDDVPMADGSAYALIVPMQFEGTPWRTLVTMVEVHAAGEADQPFVARLVENLKTSAALTQGPSSRPAADWPELHSAISQLWRTESRRTPLLYLASQTDASIAADFILVADDKLLAKLAAEITKFAGSPGAGADGSARNLGWLMDRTALQLMAQSATKSETGGEFAALLAVYGGEAGRHADTIEEIIKSVNGRADLELRLTAENLIFLEDNSPSARVRAFDWLKSKGKGPQDYDPLGDAKSRRAAIDRALTAAGGNP